MVRATERYELKFPKKRQLGIQQFKNLKNNTNKKLCPKRKKECDAVKKNEVLRTATEFQKISLYQSTSQCIVKNNSSYLFDNFVKLSFSIRYQFFTYFTNCCQSTLHYKRIAFFLQILENWKLVFLLNFIISIKLWNSTTWYLPWISQTLIGIVPIMSP